MNDTILGSTLGVLAGLGGAFLTYLATRGRDRATATLSQAQLDEQRRAADQTQRNADIKTIIDNLKEQVDDLMAEVKGLRAENRECLADRDQMRGEVRRLTGRLAELERATQGGC